MQHLLLKEGKYNYINNYRTFRKTYVYFLVISVITMYTNLLTSKNCIKTKVLSAIF